MTRTPPQSKPPVIGIAGWKNSGKTTLAVRLVEEFSRRGYRVATVKHAHHEIEVDVADADSARHRRAGAVETAVIGPKRWAIVHEQKDEPEPDLDQVLSWLSPCGLVVVEGYKQAPIRKIETRRQAQLDRRPLADGDANILAIAADHAVEEADNRRGVPVLPLDSVTEIADLIADALALPAPRTHTAGDIMFQPRSSGHSREPAD